MPIFTLDSLPWILFAVIAARFAFAAARLELSQREQLARAGASLAELT